MIMQKSLSLKENKQADSGPASGKHEARWRERKKSNLHKEKQKHDKQYRGRNRKVGMEERKW